MEYCLSNHVLVHTVEHETSTISTFVDCKVWPCKAKFVGTNFVDPKWVELGVASHIVVDCYHKFAIPTSVKGYHVYKCTWKASYHWRKPFVSKKMNKRYNPFTVTVPG